MSRSTTTSGTAPQTGKTAQASATQTSVPMDKVPESQRDAVVLRHFQGLPLAEIAGQLDCTTAAVTGLLQRGLKNLRKSLAEWEDS
jgi:RNA polymerase sigma-70 factor (ECF subfamily)